ncbi:hypothetical protein D3C80_1763230 [compost metagenome]
MIHVQVPAAVFHCLPELRIIPQLRKGLIVEVAAAQQRIPVIEIACNNAPLGSDPQIYGNRQAVIMETFHDSRRFQPAFLCAKPVRPAGLKPVSAECR